METTPTDLQHISHDCDRPLFAVLRYELMSQFFSFAKKTVVFLYVALHTKATDFLQQTIQLVLLALRKTQ